MMSPKISRERAGNRYLDEAAAMEVLKCLYEPPLTDSLFVKQLLIGATNDGRLLEQLSCGGAA
jgi:hypothetical protein